VATISRLLKIIGLLCRISSLLYISFAKETYNFKEPTSRSHPIAALWLTDKAKSFLTLLSSPATHRHRHTDKDKDTDTDTHRQTQTDRHTHTHTHTYTHTHKHTQSLSQFACAYVFNGPSFCVCARVCFSLGFPVFFSLSLSFSLCLSSPL